MPELPEVETTKRGLSYILDKQIKQIFRSNKKMRFDSTLPLDLLEGNAVKSLDRRARYLLIKLQNNKTLIVHLGMSGRMTLLKDNELDNYEIQKHDHLILDFGSDLVIFNDPRRFGFIDLINDEDFTAHKLIANLGPEPLSEEFNEKYLFEKLQKKSSNIKNVMMDNTIVVGVGNIYINESLFRSNIMPTRAANSLKKSEIKKLVNNIKEILTLAIEYKGSSINDYVHSDGKLGNFQSNFYVYGLENSECKVCKNPIKRIVQNGRSTFYCDKCQK